MGAGITMICIGLFILTISFRPWKIKNASFAKGKVCAREYKYEPGDNNNMYYITVRYFVDDIEYYSKSDFRQSYIKDGKTLLIKYNKDNPKEIFLIPRNTIFMALVWILFGIYAILSSLNIVISIF